MDKTKIDWADSTWNAVTGCLHGCEYCYARGIARRYGTRKNAYCEVPQAHICHYNGVDMPVLESPVMFMSESEDGGCSGFEIGANPYPAGFAPTYRRYKLDEYKKKKGRTIFVVSMGDLFGDWVPDYWIEEVFAACVEAPQHRYLFLTKNPKRYTTLADKGLLPKGDNYWYGTTATTETAPFFWSAIWNTFVSIEPIHSSFEIPNAPHRHVKWVIIGAESGQHKDKVIPKRCWIENIVKSCRADSIPVFMKESLLDLMGDDFIQEYPWSAR